MAPHEVTQPVQVDACTLCARPAGVTVRWHGRPACTPCLQAWGLTADPVHDPERQAAREAVLQRVRSIMAAAADYEAATAPPPVLATLTGYAILFDVLRTHVRRYDRQPYARFRDRIAPGAPRDCLERPGERFLLVMHGRGLNGGLVPEATIRTERIDDVGVYVEIDLHDTPDSREVLELVDLGILRAWSWGWPGGCKETWETWDTHPPDGGLPIRTIHHVEVIEYSLVDVGAYPTRLEVLHPGDTRHAERAAVLARVRAITERAHAAG